MKFHIEKTNIHRRAQLLALGFLALGCVGIFLNHRLADRDKVELGSVTSLSIDASEESGATGSSGTGQRGARGANRNGPENANDPPPINLSNFKADEFDAAWDAALRMGATELDQLSNLSLVVSRMSQIGEPTQIVEKIFGQFGPGKSRCSLVGTVFMTCDRLEALQMAYEKLEFPDELAAACSGLSQNFEITDTPDSIDRVKYGFLGDRFDEFLQKKLVRYISGFYSKSPQELSSAVTKSLEILSDPESKLRLLSQLVPVAPFDCLQQLASHNLELAGPERAKLLAFLFGTDAARAMEQITALPGGDKYFSPAFQEWLKNDARKPIKWLEERQKSLSLVQRESAMQGIAVFSARQGECDVAWQWVGQITDPELRKAAEGQVWTMERDMVRREASKNPELVIQSMISGESNHADYWIEEAFTTWSAKDPTKAQDWYHENWNSLPAAKAQYVAAALATQAAQQGDTATARQWATHIQDTKTKQRIEAAIAEAETDPAN